MAQVTDNATVVPNCAPADFDTDLQFVNGPGYFTVIVAERNVSRHACTLDETRYGIGFVPDRNEGQKPFKTCWDCGKDLFAGHWITKPLTLEPGQLIWQTFRWKTQPFSDVVPCLQLKWISDPVLLVTPSLLKPVCSDAEVSHFSPVPPHLDGEPLTTMEAEIQGMKLTSSKATYEEGESFAVRVSQIVGEQPWKDQDCPTLYMRQRSPDGHTRIDEVHPLAFKGCTTILGHEPGDWQSGFELDSGANSRWEGVGEHEITIFRLANTSDGSQWRFVASNTLHFTVVDPALLARHWGAQIKGVATDVTLDKTAYRLGEDVPLHIAIKNFSGNVPLYTWDPIWDPCLTVSIEVEDGEKGLPLPEAERFESSSICMGHGFGPRPFPKGKVVALERSLRALGLLPNHPGIFAVTITWCPCVGSGKSSPDNGPACLRPYATAKATSSFQVVQ